MNDKERQSAADMKEARAKLLECFPGSFINSRDEFIAHPRTNQYFLLNNCKTVEDIEAKVLEWLSRPAFKTQPYSQEWRNRRFHEFMLVGVNVFLDTDFSENDMELIYTYMGCGINHGLMLAFIDHDMSMKWLREHIPTERTSGTNLEDAEDAFVITASSTKE
uniref:Uncharacterized protein n=1 Tax=Myoviridae sp. ctCjb12 TaxID=2826631 RepID=A0A8S5MQB4_9CAUD|nr:MAG TPA: hypothetical protein [Myoviridae sp. ctCjb12]